MTLGRPSLEFFGPPWSVLTFCHPESRNSNPLERFTIMLCYMAVPEHSKKVRLDSALVDPVVD